MPNAGNLRHTVHNNCVLFKIYTMPSGNSRGILARIRFSARLPSIVEKTDADPARGPGGAFTAMNVYSPPKAAFQATLAE